MAKIKKQSVRLIEENNETIEPMLHKMLLFNESGETTEEYVYFPDGEIQEKHLTTFNEKGFISTEKIYLEGDELDYFATYLYDGDAISRITEEYGDPEENQTRQFQYTSGQEKMTVYNAANEIVSIESRGVNEQDIILWEEIKDETGQVISRQEFDYTSFGEYAEVREQTNETNRVRKYSYNDQNQLTQMVIFEEEEAIAKLTYKYDNQGNPLLELQDTTQGLYRTENTYNEEGQMLTNRIFGPDGILLEAYEFSYNEHGLVMQESFFRLDPYNDLTQEGKFEHSYEYYE